MREILNQKSGFLTCLRIGLCAFICVLISACNAAPSTTTNTYTRCNEVLPVIQSASAACAKVGRDQVCYGNRTVSVEYSDSNVANTISFAKQGDIAPLTAFKSIKTSRLDLEQREVGLALFRLQADMPGTTAGQAVTFVLYGDASFGQQDGGQAITTDSVSKRRVGTFAGGGAFYFQTRIGTNVACSDISSSGLIIQNPKGTKVAFMLNGAKVIIGSTVLFQIDHSGQMIISVMEGLAEVESNGVIQVAPAGQQLSVPLSFFSGVGMLQVSGVPSAPKTISSSYQMHNCGLARSAGLRTGCVIANASASNNTVSQGSSANNTVNNVVNNVSSVVDQACQIANFAVAHNPAPEISAGKFCTTLSWNAQGGNVLVNGEGVGGSGSREVCINNTTTFTLTLKCPSGDRSAHVTLNPAGHIIDPAKR